MADAPAGQARSAGPSPCRGGGLAARRWANSQPLAANQSSLFSMANRCVLFEMYITPSAKMGVE